MQVKQRKQSLIKWIQLNLLHGGVQTWRTTKTGVITWTNSKVKLRVNCNCIKFTMLLTNTLTKMRSTQSTSVTLLKHLLVTFTWHLRTCGVHLHSLRQWGSPFLVVLLLRKTIQIAKYGTSWVTVHSTCATQTLSQTFNTIFQLSTLSSQMVNMPSSRTNTKTQTNTCLVVTSLMLTMRKSLKLKVL